MIALWHLVPTPAGAAEMNRVARTFIEEQHPARVGFLGIVEPTSPPPGDGARSEFAAFSRDTASKMGVAVLVAEGGGFRAAFVRGVGITLTTLMPHRVPFKFVNNVTEAAELISPYLTTIAGGAKGLEEAVEELRTEVSRIVGTTAAPSSVRPRA